MDNLQWYDYMRALTAVFALVSAYRLIQISRHRKQRGETYSSKFKDYLWLLYAFFFVQISGALETLAKDGPYRWSTFLSFLISIVALRATRESEDQLITYE